MVEDLASVSRSRRDHSQGLERPLRSSVADADSWRRHHCLRCRESRLRSAKVRRREEKKAIGAAAAVLIPNGLLAVHQHAHPPKGGEAADLASGLLSSPTTSCRDLCTGIAIEVIVRRRGTPRDAP